VQAISAVTAGSEWLGDYVVAFLKSPSWTSPIEAFIRANVSVFNGSDLEDNKLEYTSLHTAFKNLIESLLAAHLLDVDVSPDEFAEIFEACCWNDARLETVAAQLASVDDFLTFKRMMKARYQVEKLAGSVDLVEHPVDAAALEQEQEQLRKDAVRLLLSDLLARSIETSASSARYESPTTCDSVVATSSTVTAVASADEPSQLAHALASASEEKPNRIAAIVANATQRNAVNKVTTASNDTKAGIERFSFTPASRCGA